MLGEKPTLASDVFSFGVLLQEVSPYPKALPPAPFPPVPPHMHHCPGS